MRKVLKNGVLVFLVVFAVLSLMPISTNAEGKDFVYTVLAPLPGTTNCGDVPNAKCETTLEKYLPGLFKLAVGLSAVAAVLFLVIGGFQYISSDAIQGKSAGKERIKNALISLVLIISAYVLLNTVNPNLLELNLNIDKVDTSSAATGRGALGRQASGADLLSGESLRADADVRNRLGTVEINNPPCTPQRTSQCINLNGLPLSMLESVRNLQMSCGEASGRGLCSVMITGGTETSLHSANTKHGPGNYVVDLASTESLNKYLKVPNPKNGDTTTKDGLNFKFETAGGYSTGNHWHVYK